MCFDMSLLLLTVNLQGVSNKHCLLPLFSLKILACSQVSDCCPLGYLLNKCCLNIVLFSLIFCNCYIIVFSLVDFKRGGRGF